MVRCLPLVGEDIDDVSHLHLVHGHLDGQRSRVLHGVEEDRGDHAADAHAAGPLVGHAGDVIAHVPQDGVCGALPGRARAHDVADVRQRVPLLLQLLDLRQHVPILQLDRAPGSLHLEHRKGVQGDVGPGPSIGSGGKVVGVGLAGNLEDGHRDLLQHLAPGCEPLCVGPRLDHLLCLGVASLHLLLHVEECIEHKDDILEGLGRCIRQVRLIQCTHEVLHVVATLHLPEQLHGLLRTDERRARLPTDDGAQKLRLGVGGVVHPRRHPVGDEVHEEVLLPGGRLLQQLRDGDGLGHVEGQRHDALRLALFNVRVVLRLEAEGLLIGDFGDLHHGALLGRRGLVAAGRLAAAGILDVCHCSAVAAEHDRRKRGI
mmetsp:Transcript_6330/g.20377  ORF Transcript_6330/g.20377 Transcript_6330/m.20377 type:complete len:373 (-) Transcript_6330:29-1147(-)